MTEQYADCTVTELGILQVRYVTVEDGVKKYHRKLIEPGDSYLGEPDNIQAIGDQVHTAAVIEEYTAIYKDGVVTVEEKASMWAKIKDFFSPR